MTVVSTPPPDEPAAPGLSRSRRTSAGAWIDLWLEAVSGPVPALGAGWLAALVLVSLQSPLFAWLMGLGLAGAFVAGLVGMGGAVFMVPLLLVVPQQVGLAALDMHTIAGITMIQVAVAGMVGVLPHRRLGHVNKTLVATLGGALMAGSFAGALVSRLVPGALLEGLFALLAGLAAVLLLAGPRTALAEIDPAQVRFNRLLGIVSGLTVGVLVGMVGAAGGFLMVPLMIYGLRVPVRVAVGSSMAIVALGGLAGSAGKIATGQVDWPLALALVSGALPGAQFGATVSRRLPAATLARLLGALLVAVAFKMWWNLLNGR